MSVAATNGIHTVIFLSFSLALGFLLVILSCAVWSNWMPIWSALSFALAPTPNACFGHLAGADSFSDYHDAYLDMGYFLTGALLMTGIALPIVLAHTGIITGTAAVLTLCGGLLVYGTSTCTPTHRRSPRRRMRALATWPGLTAFPTTMMRTWTWATFSRARCS